ncbi:stomatin-like protein 3 [Suncus etruscus]|uniref:stomatin-like protein 3 n=1 Tax=Suncus etruscus TaxID=109475 RepID=UPI002110AB47|nr:stomatin-like protein 3 [Suncus etruscus]
MGSPQAKGLLLYLGGVGRPGCPQPSPSSPGLQGHTSELARWPERWIAFRGAFPGGIPMEFPWNFVMRTLQGRTPCGKMPEEWHPESELYWQCFNAEAEWEGSKYCLSPKGNRSLLGCSELSLGSVSKSQRCASAGNWMTLLSNTSVTDLLLFHFLGTNSKGLGVCGWILFSLSLLLMIITFPISIWMCLKIIKEYERAVVFRLGRIQADKAKGPGLIVVLPCIDVFVKVDLRTITCNIPPQEILTRDSVTTQVDGVVYYRIYSAISAVANVNDVHQATYLLAQTTLRNVLGTQTLSQILSGREEIAHSIQTLLDDATELWGIRVARVEIKDVRIPVQLQRSMAAEAEATREARARVLAAEGEMNASKSLKSASMVLAESPIALQLRYLQTLTTVATEKNSTIVFPLPMNILEGIGGVSYDNHKKLPSRA